VRRRDFETRLKHPYGAKSERVINFFRIWRLRGKKLALHRRGGNTKVEKLAVKESNKKKFTTEK